MKLEFKKNEISQICSHPKTVLQPFFENMNYTVLPTSVCVHVTSVPPKDLISAFWKNYIGKQPCIFICFDNVGRRYCTGFFFSFILEQNKAVEAGCYSTVLY